MWATLVGDAARPTVEALSPRSPASSRSTTTDLARRRPTIVGYLGERGLGDGYHGRQWDAEPLEASFDDPPGDNARPIKLQDSQPVACGHPSRTATSGPT